MQYRKPLLVSLVVSGLALGAGGVASAQYGDGSTPTPEPTTQTETLQSDTGIVQVQDVEEEGNTETDGETERHHRGGCGKNLDAVAEAIGISADELQAELDNGSTIAEVAEANGVDVDDVIDAMLASAEERIDAKVAEGRITEEEAAEKLERKTDKITNRVNGVSSEGADADTSVDV